MTEKIRLGCIADDFTGATDLANNLVRTGFRVVQMNGIPQNPLQTPADAVVIALKSRTIPAHQAVAQSLNALNWLKQQDAEQIYFKYCSTFDSTPAGNIGPVTDALLQAVASSFTIATPAFPDNGRTIFKGHLFVGDQLLSDSGMKDHPLTPMRDANLVRVLQAQTTRQVGLIDYSVVMQGHDQLQKYFLNLQSKGAEIAIVDALSNDHLITLGRAVKDFPLVTAGSGLAIGLGQNFGLMPSLRSSNLPEPKGFRAVIAGSCSAATHRQVAHFIQAGLPHYAIDPSPLTTNNVNVSELADQVVAWAQPNLSGQTPILVYTTLDPQRVASLQSLCDPGLLSHRIEELLGQVASRLVCNGVGQLIVAGGETSGACVQALGIKEMQVGPQIDPGVPWCFSPQNSGNPQGAGLHLALKSGNFGTDDFFTKAFRMPSNHS